MGFQQFLSFTASVPAGFYSQKLWGLTFLEPWAVGLGIELELLTPEISFLSFICHM